MNTLPTEFFKLVSNVTIVRFVSGVDHVSFELPTLPSPFPELNRKNPGCFPTTLMVELRRGFAEEWLSTCGYTGPLILISS